MSDIPLLLFAYNRPRHLRRTLKALAGNRGASDTDLVLYSDGPKNTRDAEKVRRVRAVAKEATGFRSVRRVERTENLGLAASIRRGVGEALEEAAAVTVMEDDLLTGPGFLEWMQRCLTQYAGDDRLLSVSGYLPPRWRLRAPGNRPPVWLSPRPMSWGWGTWREAWRSVAWDRAECEDFVNSPALQARFAEVCGADVPGMLRASVEGRLDSWAIRFAYEHARRGRYALLPGETCIKPIGFDGSGVHCRPNPLRWLETTRHAPRAPVLPERAEPHEGLRVALTGFFDRHHRWIGRFLE